MSHKQHSGSSIAHTAYPGINPAGNSESFLSLANNESPFAPSEVALKAIMSAASQIQRYPNAAQYEFKQKLAAHLNCDQQQIILGNGSEEVLQQIVRTLLHPGERVVIAEYAFILLKILLKAVGIGIDEAKASANSLAHDPGNILAAINQQTKMVFLVNPNNPTGTYLTKAAILNLLTAIPPHIIVVIDAAYAEFMLDVADYADFCDATRQFSNLIVTRTFSKAYGLAGLRLGYAVAHPTLASHIESQRLPYNVNLLAATAGSIALTEIPRMQNQVREILRIKRDFVQQLQTLGWHSSAEYGNFILLYVQDAQAFQQACLNLGMLVKPLQAYCLPQCIRLSIGNATEMAYSLQILQQLQPMRLQ